MKTKTYMFGLFVTGLLLVFLGCKKEPAKSNALESGSSLPPCDSFNITVDIRGTGGAVAAVGIPFTAVRCDGESGYLMAKDGGNVPDLIRSDYDGTSKAIRLRSTMISPKSGYGEPLRLTARLELQSPVDISMGALPLSLDVAPGGYSGGEQSVNLIIDHGKFNCEYISASDASYKLSRCTDGVKNISDATVIEKIQSLELRVNGAGGNYITTVDLNIAHQ